MHSQEEIKKIKNNFIETGRLNEKKIRKDISISWHRCRLLKFDVNQTLAPKSSSAVTQHQMKRIEQWEHLIPPAYDFYLCNQELEVIYQRIEEYGLTSIHSLDESVMGTNGAAIAAKTGKTFLVSGEEHYHSELAHYFTLGLPIEDQKKNKLILMLLSDQPISGYEILKIEEKINKFKIVLEDEIYLSSLYHEQKEVCYISQEIKRKLKSYEHLFLENKCLEEEEKWFWQIISCFNKWPKVIDFRHISEKKQMGLIKSAYDEKGIIAFRNINYLTEETLLYLVKAHHEKKGNLMGKGSVYLYTTSGDKENNLNLSRFKDLLRPYQLDVKKS